MVHQRAGGHLLYLSKGQNYSKQTVWVVNFQMKEMFRPDPITVKHFHLENYEIMKTTKAIGSP